MGNVTEVPFLDYVPGLNMPRPDVFRTDAESLNRHRQDMLSRLAIGWRGEDVAEMLGNSPKTIRNTVHEMNKHLNCSGGITALAIMAHASGWFAEQGVGLVDTEPNYDAYKLRTGFLFLTSQEREVLRLRVSGDTTKDVARLLYRTPGTIQKHQEHIKAALLPPVSEGQQTMHRVITGIWLEKLVQVPQALKG